MEILHIKLSKFNESQNEPLEIIDRAPLKLL